MMSPLSAMMIILSIQILGYILFEKFNLKNWKYLLLVLILISYIFVLPDLFISEIPKNYRRCGMPILAITMGFWIIGNGLALLTHSVFWFFKRNKNSYKLLFIVK